MADFSQLPLRWFVRSQAASGAISAAFGGVEFLPGRKDAFFTKPMGKGQLDALQEKGFSILSAIPVLD